MCLSNKMGLIFFFFIYHITSGNSFFHISPEKISPLKKDLFYISREKKNEALKESNQATIFFSFLKNNVLNGTKIIPSSGQVPLLH